MKALLEQAATNVQQLLPQLTGMSETLEKLGNLLLDCWSKRGKILVAGNGGSAADAMHLAGEFSIRFHKNRKALAALALCDSSVITAAGNDYGFDAIFARQVEALGNPGDILIVFTTSGDSPNILRAISQAKSQQLRTVAFLGKGGGKARGQCDLEFVIPSQITARVQEGHKLLYHVLCEWIDTKVDK